MPPKGDEDFVPKKKEGECVKVVVRVRPLSKKEIQDGHDEATKADEDSGRITCQNPKADADEPPKTFTFDAVFAPSITQRKLYDVCSAPVVASVLEGFNGTIFAYGQTGAGKTFTMEGVQDPPELRGIIPNAFQQIFDRVALAAEGVQFLVRASYLEIYNEEVRDLLAKDPKNRLDLKENVDSGVYVKSSHEIDQVMQAGKKNRSVGATAMNAGSSRSHAIFTIIVECCDSTGTVRTGEHITVGKLNLVDLAGSERQSKTQATGDRLKEATKINLSLSALGNVISALVDGKSQHIPYRDSKLTRLLQDSLGGNTKTVMCANCGPAGYNYDETVSTLRYANRAKNIKNKPKINEDPKDAMLREFQDEIARLKAQLQGKGTYDENGEWQGEQKEYKEVEKIVHKEVIKEVTVGVSEEELSKARGRAEIDRSTPSSRRRNGGNLASMAWNLHAIEQTQSRRHVLATQVHAEAERKKEEIRERAERQLAAELERQAATEEERERLRADLVRQETERKNASQRKRALAAKLKGMENKLLKGGQLLDKAATQEAELRKAKQELTRKQEAERRMANEMRDQESKKAEAEEKFGSIEEEVEKKTRKLEKLIRKVSEAEREVSDLSSEFQREREEMLDTIRQLARQIKLKDCILEGFAPAHKVKALEARAEWDDENWRLKPLINNDVRRPHSTKGLRRPETEYARHRAQYDPDTRYKAENIVLLDLENVERTTQDYAGPDMRSHCQVILETSLDQEDVYVEGAGPRIDVEDAEPVVRPRTGRRRARR